MNGMGSPGNSSGIPYESRFISVDGRRIHYLEAGTNDPPVLLLHGIPTHAGLWRNVIPHISPCARTIAPDLIGFGQSEKPLDITYDLPAYTRFLEGFIGALDLKDVTIVGLDLGLIAGLNYAMQNEGNIRGLVMAEGFFQPMDTAYPNLPLFNRFSLWLMKNPRIARHMIVDRGEKMIEQMLATATLRKLAPEEVSQYQVPFRDKEVRRKVWLEGVGPAGIRQKPDHPGDLVDLINRYSGKLSRSTVPKLLLYGEPGMVVSEKTAQAAQRAIPHLAIRNIGPGKHFLPEDQPDAVGEAIAGFYRGPGRTE